MKAVGGGLTDKGVLNAEATKSINDRLAEQGITETIPIGTSPENANKKVTMLMKDTANLTYQDRFHAAVVKNAALKYKEGDDRPTMSDYPQTKEGRRKYGDDFAKWRVMNPKSGILDTIFGTKKSNNVPVPTPVPTNVYNPYDLLAP